MHFRDFYDSEVRFSKNYSIIDLFFEKIELKLVLNEF